MNSTKICKCCNLELCLSNFSKYKRAKDGLRPTCRICVKQYRKNNKNKLSQYDKEYYQKNKDRIIKYREVNKDKIAEYKKEYQQANPVKCAIKTAKRRAAKLNATPQWLTKENFKQIEEFYIAAQNLKLITGIEHHVDHIVPLQGSNVCGLHVPWNLQVIPAEENIRKSNKWQN